MDYQQLNKNMKGMNTKKTILFWWEHLEGENDLKSFYECIDPSIAITEKTEGNKKELCLSKSTWKYNLELVFLGTECVTIVYF